jgi:hypothetical protein
MSTQPQTEEYLQARIESCRLLGLNPDDLTAHEAIRALLAGGTADPVKLLSVVEALTKLAPEREQRSHHPDPRAIMLETYKRMRERGEIPPEGLLQARISEQAAEISALKAQLAEALATPTLAGPLPPNVVPLPRPSSTPAASPTAPFGAVAAPPPPAPPQATPGYDYDKQSDWKNWVNEDGSIRTTPRGGGHDWGPV